MSTILVSTFTSYNLSVREQLSGAILTGEQKQLLQNDLADIATNKINLDYDPAEPLKFAQTEAFLKGQMSIIQTMLARSEESAKLLLSSNPQ